MYHHSLNHLHAPVHGILLGSCASNSEFLISDVLPCFHGFPTPNVLEASLEAAEGGVKGHKKILGWYTANERMDDSEVGRVTEVVMERISANSGSTESVLVLMNNKKLSIKSATPFQVFTKDGGGKFRKALESSGVKSGDLGGGDEDKGIKKVWDFQDMIEEVEGADWRGGEVA